MKKDGTRYEYLASRFDFLLNCINAQNGVYEACFSRPAKNAAQARSEARVMFFWVAQHSNLARWNAHAGRLQAFVFFAFMFEGFFVGLEGHHEPMCVILP